jgi:hypothetical protein
MYPPPLLLRVLHCALSRAHPHGVSVSMSMRAGIIRSPPRLESHRAIVGPFVLCSDSSWPGLACSPPLCCLKFNWLLTITPHHRFEGDVYHKNHVPKTAPDGSAGLGLSVAHAMASQATSSSAKVNAKSYTGSEASGSVFNPALLL